MTTKFDVEDEIAVRGIITAVHKDLTGKISYRVKMFDVNHMCAFIQVEEEDIVSVKEDDDGNET